MLKPDNLIDAVPDMVNFKSHNWMLKQFLK